MQPKHLFNKDKWLLAENIPDMDMYFSQIFFSCFVSNSSFSFVKRYTKVLGLFKGFHLDFYFGEKDSNEVAESILKALIERPSFGPELNKQIVSWSSKLIDFSNMLRIIDVTKKTNKQLWELYNKQDQIHTKLYTYGWLPVSVDMFHNNFTNKLKSYLYSVCDSKEEAEQVFIVLTTPSTKTIVAVEREDFLNIYEKYKTELRKGKNSPALDKALQKHSLKWGHLGYIYSGITPPFGPEHYLQELHELVMSKVDGKKMLQKEKQQLLKAKQEQSRVGKKYKINTIYRRLFSVAQGFAITKLYRRHAQLQVLHAMHETVLQEIANRLQLSRAQVQYMLIHEVKDALLKNKYDKKELVERLKHCVMYAEKNYEHIYRGAIENKIRNSIKDKIDKNITEFTGQTAQPGRAKGAVKIIIRAKDMVKMNKGDIMVSIATDPDVVPAMKKAAAIVTEQGGITSHAAIVSRELGTPCVIGTKIATKVLKDGDIVEVDATKGIVKKIIG